MKRRNKKNKAILIVALILCITIGYAVLSTTLNITGNSEIKNAKWDIHFDNLIVDSSSVEATTPAVIDTNKMTINYGVHLASPGDSYSFTVDVVNEGTIDGMISTVTNTGLTEEQQKYIEYTATYTNGKELKEKDGLKAGATKSIKVSVKYKDDINPEDLPQEEKTIDLTFKVEYVQADETVTPPATPIMKSYASSSTDDYHNSTYRSKITKIVTKTNTNVPETAIEQWDVSAAGDGSVIAYIEDDGSGNGTYQVTLCGDGGKIIANEDSSNLFYNFTSLNEIDLSNFDTSNVTDMSYMFRCCFKLANLDLSSFDTSKVTDMKGMFWDCISLTNLNVIKFNTSNVTSMFAMFAYCNSLTSLDVNNFNTSKVTDMASMFINCNSLTSLDLSNFDTSNVTDIGSMFNQCSSLKSLDLRSFNIGKSTNLSNMFSNCSSLTSLDLGNFDTSNVTSMSGMFYGCSSLANLDLSNFDTSKVTNMRYMFANCSVLTSLNLSNLDTSKVTNMDNMFDGCNKLTTTITISNSATKSYYYMFRGAATESGAQIIVNYTSATSSLVGKMIATKSSNSNVVKGSLVS